MTPEILVQNMNPQIYQKLRDAVETGRWLDGNPLSEQQKETCLQAIIMYQSQHMNNSEHMTVGPDGEVIYLSKRELKQQFETQSEIARFKQDDF